MKLTKHQKEVTVLAKITSLLVGDLGEMNVAVKIHGPSVVIYTDDGDYEITAELIREKSAKA